ncbi:SusD/RagB family nutrient-binding outer membrane lipoprotein [Hymenobacter sp. BT175]|uniref:SusD/RagB family nutrient-binding outer membrane lipoprotein n=1 Tax=Hymenobacter translucens TaxID=2886507 RepID=UPI001D0EEFD3|nr:SusD/RagB family nutrient-binding outer membrane lipoprotein [Hymenobacter translucens]MCC2546998.1 SusD/RagB family nutrient-binding outer membrane lipoprotein [Hymenobacter translucens]
MRIRKLSAGLGLVGLLLTAPGCKDFFDVNVDPIHPISATNEQLLPVTQVAMATYLGFNLNGLSQPTAALMGQLSNSRSIGTFSQSGDSFNNEWSGLYTDMLNNNEQIIRQATAQQSWTFLGIAQLQKAYVVSQMVDMWGDIPYSQALQGASNRAPRFDKDSDIYNGNQTLGIQGLFSLIDEALANLAKGGVTPSNDIIYGGNALKWSRFGRSLKLKLYNQIRKTRDVSADVTTLLGQDLLTAQDDFEVKYGSTTTPENRNVGFLADYVNVGRENHIGIHFYERMRGTSAGNTTRAPRDPRLPYYFFNQNRSTVENTNVDYQEPANRGRLFISRRFGSTGRNAAAADADVRTLPGLYPIGGRFDNGEGGNATSDFGRGLVAQRLLTYFSRKYTEAEVRLMVLNDATAAGVALEEAIRASFAKVNQIAAAEGTSPAGVGVSALPVPQISAAAINTYVTREMAAYNAATTAQGKLAIIMEQKYIASFGFGLDIYTDFRRTYLPRIKVPGNADPARGTEDDDDNETASSGGFPRRLLYRQDDLTTNPNAPKQPNVLTDRIFWDVQ